MTNAEPNISTYLFIAVTGWMIAVAACIGALLTDYHPLGTVGVLAGIAGSTALLRRWLGAITRRDREMFELGRESVTVPRVVR